MSPKKIVKRFFQLLSFNKIVWNGAADSSSVFLTFDDGPHINTHKILDVLLRHNVKATFFVVGKEIDSNRDILLRIYKEGHMIALHGMTHTSLTKLSLFQYIKEMLDSKKLIHSIIPVPLMKPMIRPPYGDLSALSTIILLLMGFRILMWSKDSNDSDAHSAADVVKSISEMDVSAGDIILFHDDYANTAAALSDVIKNIEGRGYQCLRLE